MNIYYKSSVDSTSRILVLLIEQSGLKTINIDKSHKYDNSYLYFMVNSSFDFKSWFYLKIYEIKFILVEDTRIIPVPFFVRSLSKNIVGIITFPTSQKEVAKAIDCLLLKVKNGRP